MPPAKPIKKFPDPPQEDYFIAVKTPAEVRRSVLESSRKVIYALQDYHKLILLRQKKQLLFERFKDQVKEITVLTQKLNKYFPDNKIAAYREQLKAKQEALEKKRQAEAKQMETQKVVEQKVPKVAAPQPRPEPVKLPPKVEPPKSEIDQLNDLLSGIEAKLKKMN
jgi:vacuolar-type H+-ATPase subunit D/Vma8